MTETNRPEFRQKLLRLFFLFALIPAAVLSVVGYYLVIDAGSPVGPNQTDPGSDVAEYYHDLIFRQLEIALENGTTGSELGADFIFTVFEGRIEMTPGTEVVTPSVANTIFQQAQQQPRGFAEINGRAYQYLFRDEGVGGKIAVFVHDSEYARLFSRLQTATAHRHTARELRIRYSVFLGLLFLAIAAVTGIAAYIFSRRLAKSLARPLLLLSDAATAVADGDFRARVEPQGEADIRRLIDSFNRMTVQLEQTTARLAQTERVAAWRQVARRFAHELKNPLQPMLVSLYRIERLLIDTDVYDKIYEPLRATSEEVKHLKALAERFSHLAKLPPPTLEQTDLKALIGTVAALYDQPEAGYTIRLDLPPGDVVVPVDIAYLREALHNLVQNGLDASERQGEILISLVKEDHTAEISVTDHGTGMDPVTLQSARLPYFTTKREGHGLGLAIVEKSVSELGGNLVIRSVPGEGTRVSIILPTA
jgi:nitrogen fixation/metabolism regulation signal transduction histidine kinase